MKQLSIIFTICVLTLLVAGKAQAQEFELKKASGKWVIEDISYNLTGRVINGESFPPSEQGQEMWNMLNSSKAETLTQYKQEGFGIEFKDDMMIESFNDMVFGSRQVVFLFEFSPGGIILTNGSKINPTPYLSPSFAGDKIELNTTTDQDGLSTTFRFTRAK